MYFWKAYSVWCGRAWLYSIQMAIISTFALDKYLCTLTYVCVCRCVYVRSCDRKQAKLKRKC